MSDESSSSGNGAGCGIAAVGCVLLLGFVGLSSALLCGGFSTAISGAVYSLFAFEEAEPVYIEPVQILDGPEPMDPEPVVEPDSPRPIRPRPTGAGTRPVPRPEPRPEPVVAPQVAPVSGPGLSVSGEERIVAAVALSGDATEVFAVAGDGTAYPLPATLARGTYDLRVSFGGQPAFVAGSIAILDGSNRSVVCRSSLGICKVR